MENYINDPLKHTNGEINEENNCLLAVGNILYLISFTSNTKGGNVQKTKSYLQ